MPSVLFVDDEPLVLSGLRRALRALRSQWTMHFAEGAEAARAVLDEHLIDTVVSDLRMPGEDGSQLMMHIASIQPWTVRFVLTGYGDQDCILRTVPTVHRLLAKPCQPEQLIDCLDLASRVCTSDQNSAVRTILTGTDHLPVCPRQYSVVCDLLNASSPSIEDITDAVRYDAGMSIQLQRLAAGAFFGPPRPDVNLSDAASCLGVSLIRRLFFDSRIVEPVEEGSDAHRSIDALNENLQDACADRRLACLGPLLAIVNEQHLPLGDVDMVDVANQMLALWGINPPPIIDDRGPFGEGGPPRPALAVLPNLEMRCWNSCIVE